MLKYVSDELKRDIEVILAAVKNAPKVLHDIDLAIIDPSLLAEIRANPQALRYLPDHLKK